MIFRIADCAYRTKVLPGNRATDGEKKAGPRKEGRPCVILCWHVRAASRTCRSGYFGGCICVGKSARASAYGGIASIVSIRGEASAEPVTQGTKKQIAAPSCRNLLLSILADICCTISLPRNRRRSHYCRRPPAIVLRRLPFRLLPLRIGPLRSDPAGRFAGRYTYPAKPLAMHC